MVSAIEENRAFDPGSSLPLDPSAPQSILIVDDFVIDQRIAGAIVEKFPGLVPTFVSNGIEALESISRSTPLLVLTDLQMPRMDGLALVEVIRDRFPKLPVVLMTAHGSEEVAILALKAGATSYVPKKTLGRDLPKTLRQVLSISAEHRTIQRLLSLLERRESSFLLGNDPNLITPLIQLFQDDLVGMGVCDSTTRMRVGVALQEALSNALYHGNLEVSTDLRQDDERIFYELAETRRSLEPYARRRIRVDGRINRESAEFVIEDEGPGFDTSNLDRIVDPEDLMRIGGRGMILIRTFMDEVRFNEIGNRITLIKRANPNSAR